MLESILCYYLFSYSNSFHSVFMGSLEVPAQSSETIKVPTAHYEFGANFLDPKVCSMAFNCGICHNDVFLNSFCYCACYYLQLMLIGRVMTDGRLNARVKCDLTENLTLKVNAQVYGSMGLVHWQSFLLLMICFPLFY